ncbi:MAG: fluoride efflux transporter CrcB [Desulfovibrio sp.]|jgi:CrcB protein|nr:fluoride efflux transporter CrcB [Desulfovibrio sp.]
MIRSTLCICAGACLGAVLRWLAGRALNPLIPVLPLGTLAVNLFGGYLIGFALGIFAHFPGISELWRLFVITGFLGALTTFSTFSAEVVLLLQEGRIFPGLLLIFLHLVGSLGMTLLGAGSSALLWPARQG